MTFVTLDPENGDLTLTLPPAMQPVQDELYQKLTEQFMESAFDDASLARMNRFVEQWLKTKGWKG